VFDEIAGNEHLHVKLCALASLQAVVAVRIDEVVEALAQFVEAIHEFFRDLDVSGAPPSRR
jgi:hypothetical protein